ncbi:hypothetical protein BP12A_23 [Salmonella phage BP12A]|uniref:Uncharacterized protein n=1 Tax=Salmonella phage BP12A TaxID=1543199 RepID=A0A140XFN4_9CAUD|nr:hypothetical protein BJD25_gp26 [Salmonella phage BP12A]AIT13654.1 hypothetical protein BP12A_23 [Salmonella phage BP12A]
MSNPLTATEILLANLLADEPWCDELPDEFELFVSGDWTDEGKTEGKLDVVKHLPSGRFFECFFTRYGDHWQGYETSFDGCSEVEPYEATVILWKEVK